MEFDPEALRPTFRLRIGVPGRSMAMEIARALGFPEEVLARAKRYLTGEGQKLDEGLARLERGRGKLPAGAGGGGGEGPRKRKRKEGGRGPRGGGRGGAGPRPCRRGPSSTPGRGSFCLPFTRKGKSARPPACRRTGWRCWWGG